MDADKATERRMGALECIRKYCLWCAGGRKAVAECPDADCALFAWRMGTRPRGLDLRPERAIRRRCMQCTGADPQAVRACDDHGCLLWPRRIGVRPQKLKKRLRRNRTTPMKLPGLG
jgi:hypothetical protein